MQLLPQLRVVAPKAVILITGLGLGLIAFDVASAWADALLLVDVDSGRVIGERSSTHPWYPGPLPN
jgi:hypothetical protein